MNNRGLLIVIALVVVGILGVLVMQYQQREKPLGERIGDSASEVVEEVQDEIDDNTTAK